MLAVMLLAEPGPGNEELRLLGHEGPARRKMPLAWGGSAWRGAA